MKKAILFLLSIAMIISVFSGCKTNPAVSDNSSSVSADSSSVLTVKTKSNDVPNEFKGKNIIPMTSLSDYAFVSTMDNIVGFSSATVKATVNGFTYTSLGQNAWTIIHVTVNETIKGKVPEKKDLDIYTFGGYIPLKTKLGNSLDAHGTDMTAKELENSVVYEYTEESELPEIGKEYVFYLVPGNESMPKGSYERLCGSQGQLEVSADGKSFTRNVKNNKTETYSANELK